MKPSVIYVDMESLFDLRQGVLATEVNDENALTEYLLSEEYNFRSTDNLKFIGLQRYREVLRHPTKEILENSTITRILLSLKTKLDSIENRNKFYNESKEPQILLNVYPFQFTQEELDHIVNLLFVRLDSPCVINVTYSPLSSLSPFYIKSNEIAAVFMYRFNEWVETHKNAIPKMKLPDTIFYFPALYDREPTEEELKKIHKLGFKDPISYTEFIFSGSTSINFLPTVFYSNLVTALHYLDKFTNELKKEFVDEEAEEKYGDIISKIQVS